MRRYLGILGALGLVVIVAAFYVGSALAATPTPAPSATPAAPASPGANGVPAVPKALRGERGFGMMGLGTRFRGWADLRGHTLDRVAQKLNMSTSDLLAALQKGQTLKDIAASKNVSESDLADYILAPLKDSLAVDVKYGQMTQQQADAALANAKQALTKLMETPLNQVRSPQIVGISTQTLDRVAQKLGMQLSDLQAALQKGQSLKDVAASKNLSESDLVNLIVAPQQEQIAIRVKYGYETQQQADQQLQNLKSQVTRLVETPGDQLRVGNGARGNMTWPGRAGKPGRNAQPKATPAPSASGATS